MRKARRLAGFPFVAGGRVPPRCRLLAEARLGVGLALVLGVAGHRLAFLHRHLVVGLAAFLRGVTIGFRPLLACLGLGLGLVLVGLGPLHAEILVVALHLVATLLGGIVACVDLVVGHRRGGLRVQRCGRGAQAQGETG